MDMSIEKIEQIQKIERFNCTKPPVPYVFTEGIGKLYHKGEEIPPLPTEKGDDEQ